VTERASKHAHRRSERAADLEAVARTRVRQIASSAATGWVPSAPIPIATPPPARPALPPARALVRDRLPLAARGVLVEPGSRALAGIVSVLVLGLALGALLIWRGRPATEPVPPVHRVAPPAAAARVSPAATATSAATLVVHVAGAVRRPGLVQLRAGARVADAVAAAGGPARNAELASVNLAQPVVDGEQLVVLARGQGPAVAAPPAAGGTAAGPSTGPLDLNSATLEQLDSLPGVGPVLAQRILDWRAQHGRFGSTDELREVSGIGEATFADIKPLVRV
jgi:competence protein ComEA